MTLDLFDDLPLAFMVPHDHVCGVCGKPLFAHQVAGRLTITRRGVEIEPYYPIKCKSCYKKDQREGGNGRI